MGPSERLGGLLSGVWEDGRFDPERTEDVFKVGSGHREGLPPARGLHLEFGRLCGEGPSEASAELGLPFAGRGSALGRLGTTWWRVWIREQGPDSQ